LRTARTAPAGDGDKKTRQKLPMKKSEVFSFSAILISGTFKMLPYDTLTSGLLNLSDVIVDLLFISSRAGLV
jgi:hypothetical protein